MLWTIFEKNPVNQGRRSIQLLATNHTQMSSADVVEEHSGDFFFLHFLRTSRLLNA